MKKNKLKMVFLLAILLFVCVAGFELCSILHQLFSSSEDICGTGAAAAATVKGEEDIVIRNGDLTSSKVAITCNVDWGEDVLPSMLETLKEKEVTITFFVSGKWAKKNPTLLRKMYIAGHEIQSHGYSHKLSSRISKEEVREEIQKTEEEIHQLIGEKTTIFAPPSGDYNEDTVQLCRDMNYKLSLWSADTIDWRPGSTADIISSRVLKKNLHGGIILMHPKAETAKALPGLIEKIKKQELTFVPLCELAGL